ncbi:hypothetical protein C8F04DRAFT_1258535 [Mycena alexandri]|uniref:HMG box domain-containing protein n=1 Tax=Mycena alexandri TaxID=1745969 RepID=A0AAD6X5P7_9AGAR|nr:hypothetical protein C8F04DRAFT_1258535 [Mycena alexandri]
MSDAAASSSDPPQPPKLTVAKVTEIFKTNPDAKQRFLDQYHTFERTQGASVKGSKGKYLEATLIPEILKIFAFGEYNNSSIVESCTRWFTNNGLARKVGQEPKPTKVAKPAAPAPKNLFVSDKRAALTEQARSLQPASDVGKGSNLKYWRTVVKESWEELSEDEKAAYVKRAQEEKSKLDEGPPAEHIYKNQKQISSKLSEALGPLVGHGWGGLGDVAIFIGGVYLNEVGRKKVFTLSSSNHGSVQFKHHINNFNDLRRQLETWGDVVLPNAEDSVAKAEDGAPLLPPWTEDISFAETRRLLLVYGSKLYDWMKSPVPEQIDDIAISFQEGEHPEGGVFELAAGKDWEDFYPAKMEVVAVVDLYSRLFELQGADNPTSARFRSLGEEKKKKKKKRGEDAKGEKKQKKERKDDKPERPDYALDAPGGFIAPRLNPTPPPAATPTPTPPASPAGSTRPHSPVPDHVVIEEEDGLGGKAAGSGGAAEETVKQKKKGKRGKAAKKSARTGEGVAAVHVAVPASKKRKAPDTAHAPVPVAKKAKLSEEVAPRRSGRKKPGEDVDQAQEGPPGKVLRAGRYVKIAGVSFFYPQYSSLPDGLDWSDKYDIAQEWVDDDEEENEMQD